MSTSSLDGWAEFAPFHPMADTKSVTPFLSATSDNPSPNNAFAYAWPGVVSTTFHLADVQHHDSQNHIFGLSPSVTGMDALPNFHPHQDGRPAWPVSSDTAQFSSHATSTGFNTQSTMSSLETPIDVAPSHQGPFLGNSHTEESFDSLAKTHQEPSADMFRSSENSSSSATISADLLGYHNNVAANHANHLADLVKTSAIIGSGHLGPRSLASSLSRSVMSATAYSQPDPTTSPPHPDNEKLSIQQRRRVSQQEQKHRSNVYSDSSFPQHQRQYSAPDPCMPASSDGANSQIGRPRRAPTVSSDGYSLPFGLVPRVESSQHEWTDALLANSHDLVFVLSLKGTVLFISPSVQRILGFAPEEIVGRPLVDLSHPADVGPCSRELKEAITCPEEAEAQSSPACKGSRRVDLIMRMACKSGGFCLIETVGKVSVDPPKQRKVIVCSGRPHPIPMLPWKDVRGDLNSSELSAWLKISHNGIFLGSTGPINRILGIEDVNLLGRHIRDLPMVTSSTDLLEALRCGRSISVQDHYDGSPNKAPVRLTVYPWTSGGRSNALAFVHVQQQPLASAPLLAQVSAPPASPTKRKADSDVRAPIASQAGAGSLSGSSLHSNGSSVPVMSATDAAATVFSELTGFHSGSWLIEMQKLHNTNRRLRHELNSLRKRSPATISKPVC